MTLTTLSFAAALGSKRVQRRLSDQEENVELESKNVASSLVVPFRLNPLTPTEESSSRVIRIQVKSKASEAARKKSRERNPKATTQRRDLSTSIGRFGKYSIAPEHSNHEREKSVSVRTFGVG